MVNEKERIIKKMGIDCEILFPDGERAESKFLVRRATNQFSNMLAIESQRKGDFIHGDGVGGGCIVKNLVSDESYIVVATSKDTFKDMVLSTVCVMFVCNANLSAYTFDKKADEYGNITSERVEVLSGDLVYAQAVDQTLVQYAPGLHSETEFVIYCPYLNVDVLDTLILNNGLHVFNLKVITNHSSNYPGITVIEAKTEGRA